MKDQAESQLPIACDMSVLSPDQRATHMATSQELFSRLEEIREFADGYEFRLANDSSAITMAAGFISLERLCCPFLNFGLEIKSDGGQCGCVSGAAKESKLSFVRRLAAC